MKFKKKAVLFQCTAFLNTTLNAYFKTLISLLKELMIPVAISFAVIV
jgi:hypothetical protein